MCIPEVLETQKAMCYTYEQVKRMSEDGWGLIQSLIREVRLFIALPHWQRNAVLANDDLCRTSRRLVRSGGTLVCARARRVRRSSAVSCLRLLATRSSAPARTWPAWSSQSGTKSTERCTPPSSCHGYFILTVTGAEVRTLTIKGQATGETYDSNTLLIQKLALRMQADREELNAQRAAQGLAPYPEILHVWTMRESAFAVYCVDEARTDAGRRYQSLFCAVVEDDEPPREEARLHAARRLRRAVFGRRPARVPAASRGVPAALVPDGLARARPSDARSRGRMGDATFVDEEDHQDRRRLLDIPTASQHFRRRVDRAAAAPPIRPVKHGTPAAESSSPAPAVRSWACIWLIGHISLPVQSDRRTRQKTRQYVCR